MRTAFSRLLVLVLVLLALATRRRTAAFSSLRSSLPPPVVSRDVVVRRLWRQGRDGGSSQEGAATAASAAASSSSSSSSSSSTSSSSSSADDVLELRQRLRETERERDRLRKKVVALERSLAELNDEELKALEGLGSIKRVRRSVERSLGLLQRRLDSRRRGRGQLAFVAEETQSTLRIVLDLLKSGQLFDDVLPAAATNPLLLSHSLAFYSNADKLEPFVPNIAPVLVDHLPTIEPHL